MPTELYTMRKGIHEVKEYITNCTPDGTWVMIKSSFRYGGHGEEQVTLL